MKINLTTLGFPKLTGILIQAQDRSNSGTDYKSSTAGTAISEIYLQDYTGDLQTMEPGQGIGFLKTMYIPYSAFATTISLRTEDKIAISSDTYEIQDIALRENSYFEDHYELNVKLKNV